MGVLVSGRGTNLQALLGATDDPAFPARLVAVASNRAGCPALDVARVAELPVAAFPVRDYEGDAVQRDRAMAAWLRLARAEILVLAGYDRIVTAPLLESFRGRILNLHNSLLPAFAGTMEAVEAALEYGVKVTGCTVHLVEEGAADGGPIVLQAAVPVLEEDDPASLLQRIHEEEWRLLPVAVRLLAEGRIRVDGRRVRIREVGA